MLKPPFEIYHDDCSIKDFNGHVCTAENAELARAILACLNSVVAPHPVVAEKPVLTPERLADWVELAFLRVRDAESTRSVSHDPLVRVLNEVCDHIAAFRKEFRDHG